MTPKALTLIYKKSCPNQMTFPHFKNALNLVAGSLYSTDFGNLVEFRNPEEKLLMLFALIRPDMFSINAYNPVRKRSPKRREVGQSVER
jgi:hypothetical protein